LPLLPSDGAAAPSDGTLAWKRFDPFPLSIRVEAMGDCGPDSIQLLEIIGMMSEGGFVKRLAG
jgi:hypothetical protein